jgi:hypothetical protein
LSDIGNFTPIIIDEQRQAFDIVALLCSTIYTIRSRICGHGDGLWHKERSQLSMWSALEVAEIRDSDWRSPTSFQLVPMGLIRGNLFGSLHSLQEEECRALRESFTGVNPSQ